MSFEDGFLYRRLLYPGYIVGVVPLTFGRARIVIGPADDVNIDDGW
jgi:hypothetical protein